MATPTARAAPVTTTPSHRATSSRSRGTSATTIAPAAGRNTAIGSAALSQPLKPWTPSCPGHHEHEDEDAGHQDRRGALHRPGLQIPKERAQAAGQDPGAVDGAV